MSRLPRPAFNTEIKCRAALRQLGEMWPDQVMEDNRRKWGVLLVGLLEQIAELLGGTALHLDHDPALKNRPYNPRIKNVAARYTPNANDVAHLVYRVVRDEGPAVLEPGPLSHYVKTHVRGEGARRSDTSERVHRRRVEKNRDRRAATTAGKPKRASKKATKLRGGKQKWNTGRKLQSRNNLKRRK